jgi:hypothetical protein
MPDPTAADRQRRWRERQAERLPPVVRIPCQACPTLRTGVHGDLCQRCWLKLTPEGRADVAERVRRSRARRQRRADDNL